MTRPLRVLQVIPSLDAAYGGPATILHSVLPLLPDVGVESEVVTTADDLARLGPARSGFDDGLRAVVHEFPRANWLGWYYAPGLMAWLRANISRFDVVHFRSLYNYLTLAASRSAQAAGIARLCETEGSVMPWSRSYKRLKKVPYLHLVERRNALRSEGFLVTHAIERAALLDLLPAKHGRILEMPPPVLSAGDVEAGGSQERRNILYLSRLHTKKGLELLLDAYARIEARVGRLQIAGSGTPDYERELRRQAARLGLSDRVDFLGHISGAAKERAFQRARLFALASWDENFGVAVVEAVGRGVPVIASDAVAAALDLADRGLARLFPVGDGKALTETLARSWEDIAWQQDVARRGPVHVEEHYTPAAHAARLAEGYRTLLAREQ